jgi:hypothetical protein
MRRLALTICLFGPLALAQEPKPKIFYGVNFQYDSWGSCIVESGDDVFGHHIFRIMYRRQNGEVLHPAVRPDEIKEIESLLSQVKRLTFDLPYDTSVLQFDGEGIKVELLAGSYSLTYQDDFQRARKQPVIEKLVKLLISIQPQSSTPIHKPMP